MERWYRSADLVADPLVCAVVPVYGAGRFMRGLLEDLTAQTIADRLEIVIVDTASPTDEGDTVRDFQERFPSIVYLRTETRENATVALNRCIAAARAPYVAIACADDRHRRDAYERLVAALEAHPEVGLAYADSAVTVVENQTLQSASPVAHFRWPEFDPRLLFRVCYVGPQPMWRRALHERYGRFDPAFAAASDYEFWLRLVAAGERFLHLPEVLGLYLWSAASSEHANRAAVDAQSEAARVRHWPAAWGPRPAPGGQYMVPVVEKPRPDPPALRAVPPPLVSVIIPTHDRPDRLKVAVESVLRQTYPEIEVVVVNDAGRDVGGVLAGLGDGGRIVSLRLGRNRERAAARNAGLRVARGTYVAYLDDDDWFEPEHVETLVRALEQSGAAVAYSEANRVTEVKEDDTYVAKIVDHPYSKGFDLDELLVCNNIPTCCLMHRRALIDEVGGFDEQLDILEDWDLILRLARRHPFVHVRKTTCCFTWRDDGSSTTSRRKPDFVRTTALIHARYAADASPPVAAMQKRFLAALRVGAGPPRFGCSIVIPVGDDAPALERCLVELARVTRGVEYEVVLVDGGAGPATRALLASLGGDVRVVRTAGAPTPAAAGNAGAAAARGEHLAFLHPDTVPREGWLRALLAVVEREPDVGVAGSLLLYPDGSVQHAGVVLSRVFRCPYHVYRRFPGWAPGPNRRRDLQAVAGAAMLVRRADFEAAGGFDPDAGPGFEDVDLCLRLRERGRRVVYEPRSILYHVEGFTGGPIDHANDSAEAFMRRWAERWVEDEDAVYVADGYAYRAVAEGDGVRESLERLADDDDARRRWERVAEVQRLAAARGFPAVVPLLADADAWPADDAVLGWGARLAARAGLPEAADAFRRRLGGAAG